jgi:predicted RNase H-like nuclease
VRAWKKNIAPLLVLNGWNQRGKDAIIGWQCQKKPAKTIILLDQPTSVRNSKGQRPVENLVAAPVSLRYGGVQPANTAKFQMFGEDAPVWHFLAQFGDAANPHEPTLNTQVFETYPVLVMIALGWILPDEVRPTGRLPKYNPVRTKTFSIHDWVHVCQRALSEFVALGLKKLPEWLAVQTENRSPRKADQDRLDSCICLLVALHLAEMRECLMVGDMDTGYIVVPSGSILRSELHARCDRTGRTQGKWVRSLVLRSV